MEAEDEADARGAKECDPGMKLIPLRIISLLVVIGLVLVLYSCSAHLRDAQPHGPQTKAGLSE